MILKYIPLSFVPAQKTLLQNNELSRYTEPVEITVPAYYFYEIPEFHFRHSFKCKLFDSTSLIVRYPDEIHSRTDLEFLSNNTNLMAYLWSVDEALYTPPKTYTLDSNIHIDLYQPDITLEGIWYITPHKKSNL